MSEWKKQQKIYVWLETETKQTSKQTDVQKKKIKKDEMKEKEAKPTTILSVCLVGPRYTSILQRYFYEGFEAQTLKVKRKLSKKNDTI